HLTDVAKVYGAQPPHVGWNSMAQQLAHERNDSIERTARILALMNMSLSDGHVTVFESKYHYNLWRPETAIPRGAEDNNPRTTASAYTPLIVTPCFPAYPSAHGIGAGTASKVLRHFYGNGGHNLTNSTPSVAGVTLTYTNIEDIVQDVSDARVYGGIHFRYDQDAAEASGRQISRYNIQHWLGRDHQHCDHWGADDDDGAPGED
ncbi:MAG TPA: vanadium-dependent haloperoxidase, partial [Kofleriaceae bacterium]